MIEGRQPFPRTAPPYREGLTTAADDQDSDNTSPGVGLVLANNVETLANVPGIVINGADWFRTLGTSESPGTVVCTVSGDTRRAGVAEFPMGTTIGEIIEEIGGGAREDRRIVAAISGVANAILPVELFDTPACYDAMRTAGSGLGAAGFIVFDDAADLIAVAEGVSRFLAVESCGQCEPCKRDGMAVAAALDDLRRSESDGDVTSSVRDWLGTITDGARCYLATQHQVVATSILDRYPESVAGHVDRSLPAAEARADRADRRHRGRTGGPRHVTGRQAAGLVVRGRGLRALAGGVPGRHARRREPRAAAPPLVGGVTSAQDTGEAVGAGDDEVDARRRRGPARFSSTSATSSTSSTTNWSERSWPPRQRDGDAREAAIAEFADQLRHHVKVTTEVLLPWVRRVGGDEGERVAERAEAIQAAAESLVEALERDSSDATSKRPLHELADELHRLILDEERRVLPLLEQHLGDSELDDIGRAMHEV